MDSIKKIMIFLWRGMKPILRKVNFLYLKLYVLKGYSTEKRIDYQRRFIQFDISPSEKVLDVGSGGEPFIYATHLCDPNPGKTQHRYNDLKTDNKPFAQVSAESLPYSAKEFDYVYCAHVLEHVGDPAKACDEIMRVGKRGYIETPTRMSDIMSNFTRFPNFHKWHVTRIGNTLIFNEYQVYEQRDMGTDEFYHMVHAIYPNAMQRMFKVNNDLFVNMFLWSGGFNYFVFNKKGELTSSFVYTGMRT